MDRKVEKQGYSELWYYNGPEFCGKALVFKSSGVSTSLHYHKLKREHFVVGEGEFIIQIFHGSDYDWDAPSGAGRLINFLLGQGDDLHIHPRMSHRIISLVPASRLYEFSTTHFDDDSFRLDQKRSWTG